MSIEAMKQALEALEEWEKSMSKGSLEAHRILRTAIAEAEKQKPVAFIAPNGDLRKTTEAKDHWEWGAEFTPLYTTPPAAQRQPLTDDRIGQIIEQCKITLVNYCSGEKQTEFARAIEAAHGIKENT